MEKTFDEATERVVEEVIGNYKFKNKALIHQAFVRSSFANENACEDNEVLEFIGDRAIETAVVKLLIERFGNIPTDLNVRSARMVPQYPGQESGEKEFCCELDEAQLTEVKKRLVKKSNLAYRMRVLDLARYLCMGKGDEQNDTRNEDSVLEDLFEAIVGAVALDSCWNIDKLCEVVDVMLDLQSETLGKGETNYVEEVQNYCLNKYGVLPMYHFDKATMHCWYDRLSYSAPILDSCFFAAGTDGSQNYYCILKVGECEHLFRGYGRSKGEARRDVCRFAYEVLTKSGEIAEPGIRSEIENPCEAEAIGQLETLARRGYFSIPEYIFDQGYDIDGNPVWQAKCVIDECKESFSAKASSKVKAKKAAAYEMLRFLLSEEDERRSPYEHTL